MLIAFLVMLPASTYAELDPVKRFACRWVEAGRRDGDYLLRRLDADVDIHPLTAWLFRPDVLQDLSVTVVSVSDFP
jgi:hypothetical protein